MSAVDGLTGENPKWGLVAVTSTASIDTFLAGWLIFVAFDFPDSIGD